MALMIGTSQGPSAGHEMTNLSGTYSLHVEIGDVISRFGNKQNGKRFLILRDVSQCPEKKLKHFETSQIARVFSA